MYSHGRQWNSDEGNMKGISNVVLLDLNAGDQAYMEGNLDDVTYYHMVPNAGVSTGQDATVG